MCWFKKKAKIKIESKYHKGDFVNFRYKDELCFGWIWGVYQKEVDSRKIIFYDIQIGGQCPAVLSGIPETKILGLKKN